MPDRKEFKAKIFKVETPNQEKRGKQPIPGMEKYTDPASLEEAIERANNEDIKERQKKIHETTIRLEHYERREGKHLLNFTKSTYAGPGKITEKRAIRPFDMEETESFGHETALLYDPATSIVLIEHNPSGVGTTAVADYLKSFTSKKTKYNLIPVLDEDASARARNHPIIKTMIFRMAIGEITARDKELGLDTIKAFAKEMGGESILVEISAKNLDRTNVSQKIKGMIFNKEELKIRKLKQKSGGENTAEIPMELIDLLQGKNKTLTDHLKVNPKTRNTPHEERWDALTRMNKDLHP